MILRGENVILRVENVIFMGENVIFMGENVISNCRTIRIRIKIQTHRQIASELRL